MAGIFDFADFGGARGRSNIMFPTGPAPVGGGSSNQFFPQLPSMTPPGGNGLAVPGAGGGWNPGGSGFPGGKASATGTDSGFAVINPEFQGVANNFSNWLQTNIGQGVSPFNLRTNLPGGGTTAAGQLNAPLDQILSQMNQWFSSGGTQGGIPGLGELGALSKGGGGVGMDTLSQIAKGGISALPVWNQMKSAMQRQTDEGRAQLQETMNVGGGLVGSPYGSAMADYQLQSNKDLESLLGQLQFQGIQDQIGAAGTLSGIQENAAGSLAGMGMNLGNNIQQMNQDAIGRMYQEFIRTRPQYNPMLPYMQNMSSIFPPTTGTQSGQGIMGGIFSGMGDVAKALGPALPALIAMCWVAGRTYGYEDHRTGKLAVWMLLKAPSWFTDFYMTWGRQLSDIPEARRKFKPFFDRVLREEYGVV